MPGQGTKRPASFQSINVGDSGESDLESASAEAYARKKVRWMGKSSANSDEEESDPEPPPKICLATLCSHGRVGCAYYEPVRGVLYVLEDTEETMHHDLVGMLLEQVNPDVVFTSSKSDDEFINALNNHMETSDGLFQIRPAKDFLSTKGRDRLLSLHRLANFSHGDSDLPPSSDIDSTSSRPTNAYDFMHARRETRGDPTSKRWNALIRLTNFANVDTSPLCVASIGALLDYLSRERALSEFDEDDTRGLDINSIEIVSLEQVMQINADALLSLQVFENESHASVHSDKTKEGLSLFGTLNRTKTSLGRSLLRTWLLRPSLSLAVIQSRHDAVACFTLGENLIVATQMHNHLKGMKNTPRVMAVMRTGKARLPDWQSLVKFTFHATMLRDVLPDLHEASHIDIVDKLISSLDVAAFREVGIKINDIIDWEESSNNERVCVRPHVDEDLDNRKHIYHGIDSVLSTVAQQISVDIPPEFARSLNVVYFPQLGYLVCVPMLEEWRTEAGIRPLDGWTFQFSSEEYVYFKSQEMHDMDTYVGDLHSTIVDRELEIIQELLEEVLGADEAIGEACDMCAELDCLLSFAQASQQFGYRRPDMVENNVIDIIQGRHPLHEQVVDTFVPNDSKLMGGAGIGSLPQDFGDGQECHSVVLCTGANACGKSVYLKQIALIQIMAQIGCFVPAENATLGVVDKIFTRVSTRESVSKVQSAFMIDLAQVSIALRNCTSRSLVVLDEFGKGTLSTDGAGLFCGVLRHLLNRGTNCPKVLAATHFHDVFNEDLLDPENIPISFRHMQVMFTSSTGAVLESHSVSCSPSPGYTSPYTGITSGNTTTNTTPRGESVKVGPGEKITYLYRVAEGISLESHAAKCAEIFGIPSRIVGRAQYVSQLLSTHELGRLLDEEMSEAERADLADAEAVCRRFIAWDLEGDVEADDGTAKIKLGKVLGRKDLEGDETE